MCTQPMTSLTTPAPAKLTDVDGREGKWMHCSDALDMMEDIRAVDIWFETWAISFENAEDAPKVPDGMVMSDLFCRGPFGPIQR